MQILGIETSCDETSASVVENGKTILANIVHSQIEIHKKYNGVVPEIASRNHLEKILEILDSALPDGTNNIDAVAVTNGPGLVGSLLIGLSTAKAIAYALNCPLIPVNHIYAHMYSPHLFHDILFPYIGLVVSGGHTVLFLVNSYSDIKILGSTIDDAIGEAYDKVAKLLGLGYPGGPVIDQLASSVNSNEEMLAEFADMPRILENGGKDRYNFSYSGLKTAIAYRMKRIELNEINIRKVAAVFQNSAIEILVRKAKNALLDYSIPRLVISGGVAANSHLRREFENLKSRGIQIFTAPVEYCGDNAAMVAGRGFIDFELGNLGNLKTDAYSRIQSIKKGKRDGQ